MTAPSFPAIRKAQPSDASRLAQFARQIFRETFRPHNSEADMCAYLDSSFGTPQQKRELDDPAIATLLAEEGDRLVGYAQLRHSETPACVDRPLPIELWRFYVARDRHGTGLAQRLIREVTVEARAQGAQTIWLGVWEHNLRAQAFYKKTGFVDVGSHPFLLGSDLQTDRIMVSPLDTDE